MRRFRYRGGFGFGRLFALLFLLRHPLVLAVVVVVAFGVYLYRSRRR